MTLAIGSRIGAYVVVAKLGEGGMGEVYRARDSRLDRDVAIKVLPTSFASDADRVTRFTREARMLAALNHPNVAALYGVEEQGAVHALVMELVEGEDLAEIIVRRGSTSGVERERGLPLAEALPIARQIVDALEAAHESGIVHRDLKPANIKVKSDGTVKVLDFGLAKAAGADGPAAADAMNSPTLTARGTQMGTIVGTAAYMAPEQARGRPIDKRADIWAFGCVLYEMLSGTRAFKGDDVSETLAAVLRDTPDVAALPKAVPPRVRTLIARCLERNVKLRLRDIGDARPDLADATGEPASTAEAAAIPGPVTQRRSRLAWLAAGLVAGALTWAAAERLAAPIAVASHWSGTRLGGPAWGNAPAVSPDGELLAFDAMVGGLDQVAVMRPKSGNWTVLTNDRSHGTIEAMCWAADGSRIYFERRTDSPIGIFSVPALGGEQRLVLENAGEPIALHDGSLIVGRINAARQFQLYRFHPASGALDALPFVVVSHLTRGPNRELPDHRVLVYGWPIDASSGEPRLYALSPDSGQFSPVGPSTFRSNHPVWLSVKGGDMAVYAGLQDRGGYAIVRFMADSAAAPEWLFNVTEMPFGDVDARGNVYMSLDTRDEEALAIRSGSATPEHLGAMPSEQGSPIVALGNGAIAAAADTGPLSRVLVARPQMELTPLLETDEPSWGPIAPIGGDRVALQLGTAPDLATLDAVTGRLIRRFPAPKDTNALGASPDGRTLYYAADGMISAMPIDGGTSRQVGPGDSFAVDPETGDLIVELIERDAVKIVRQPSGGGASRPIEITGPYRVTLEPLQAGAVHGGRLALTMASADSWYWMLGALDLRTGRLEKVPVDYFTDFHFATWLPDGRMLGTGLTTTAILWKFGVSQK